MKQEKNDSKLAQVEEAVKSLHARLDDIQFNRSLEESKFVVLDQDGYGFGAQFERRMLGLQFADMLGRCAVFVNEYNPPYAPCFEPTGRFTYEDIKHLPQGTLDFNNPDQGDQVAFFDFDSFWSDPAINRPVYHWVPEAFNGIRPLLERPRPNWTAPDFKTLDAARRLYEGQLLSRFTYLPEYAQGIAEVKKRIGFESPMIGVHIRRGDKHAEAPYVPIDRYHAEILATVKETGINRVFVTSDDPGVFPNLPNQGQIEYIYDDEEPRYNNANHEMIAAQPELAAQETLTALKIYDLLSCCDVIVGQNNAHLTNLAICRNEAEKLGQGDYRILRGDYISKFRYAEMKYWPEVWRYKMKRLRKSPMTKPMRRVLRPIKRALLGS